MLRLACLLLSFTGAPADCPPAPAVSAPTAPAAAPATAAPSPTCHQAGRASTEVVAATATVGMPSGDAPNNAEPAATPASAPRPASAPSRVNAPSWHRRLPGMFR